MGWPKQMQMDASQLDEAEPCIHIARGTCCLLLLACRWHGHAAPLALRVCMQWCDARGCVAWPSERAAPPRVRAIGSLGNIPGFACNQVAARFGRVRVAGCGWALGVLVRIEVAVKLHEP